MNVAVQRVQCFRDQAQVSLVFMDDAGPEIHWLPIFQKFLFSKFYPGPVASGQNSLLKRCHVHTGHHAHIHTYSAI